MFCVCVIGWLFCSHAAVRGFTLCRANPLRRQLQPSLQKSTQTATTTRLPLLCRTTLNVATKLPLPAETEVTRMSCASRCYLATAVAAATTALTMVVSAALPACLSVCPLPL